MHDIKKDLELFSNPIFNKASAIWVVCGAAISVGVRPAFIAYNGKINNLIIDTTKYLIKILPVRKIGEDG